MPRYHFDIEESGTSLHDEDGEVCDSPQEAETKARNFAVEMIRNGFSGDTQIRRTIEVREETAESLLSACSFCQMSMSSV